MLKFLSLILLDHPSGIELCHLFPSEPWQKKTQQQIKTLDLKLKKIFYFLLRTEEDKRKQVDADNDTQDNDQR